MADPNLSLFDRFKVKYQLINVRGVSSSIASDKLYYEREVEDKAMKKYYDNKGFVDAAIYLRLLS
jgi:hypothetical protein